MAQFVRIGLATMRQLLSRSQHGGWLASTAPQDQYQASGSTCTAAPQPFLLEVAAARCCHRHRTRKTCLLALPLGAVSVLSLTRFGYLSRERCHRWLPVLRGRNRREVSIGCWQPVPAWFGHALGEEGLWAVSPQWHCAGWRQVADPLFWADRAGVPRGPRLARGVRTPDRTGGLGQTAVSCGATIPWRGGLGGWDIGVEAFAAQLVINRRLTHGRHGRGTASEGRINRCVRPVDEAVNADESRIRQSRCVVAGAPSVHSGKSMVGR